jgi:hypothetical protein
MKWILGALGLLFAGCDGAPAYTIEVQNVPEGTTALEVSAHVGGALAKNTPTVAWNGARESFTFGLNLGRGLQGEPAISVAARREDGCILAVGTGKVAAGSSNLKLAMIVPEPGVSDDTCKAQPPVILSAIRRQEGPLTNMHSSMLIYGWGFKPNANVVLKSPFPVQCDASNVECAAACPTLTTCAFKDFASGNLISIPCRKDCTVQKEIVHSGPALIQLDFDSSKNFLQEGTVDTAGSPGMSVRSVDLLQLLSGPLEVSLSDPEDASISLKFSEVGLSGATISR